MKQRAIDLAIAKRRAEIVAKKEEISKRASLVLAFSDVKKAHDNYVSWAFKNARGGFDDEEKLAKQGYIDALKKHGYSEDDLHYAPSCPICGDTLSVGGKVCACVRAAYVAALKNICEIEARAPFTFDDANFDAIKDDAQRENLKKFFDYFKLYASKLPAVKAKTTVLFGRAGAGKTCIASAVARAAIERGKSVKFVSAYEFDTAMLNYHTSSTEERTNKLDDYLAADLLVIDDLGTEPILKNVTEPYLLLVLEERQNRGLCTLVTCNLSPERILERYGERIYSRLANKQSSRIFELGGRDLRLN